MNYYEPVKLSTTLEGAVPYGVPTREKHNSYMCSNLLKVYECTNNI